VNLHSVWLVCFYTAFCLYVCIFFLCATILVNKDVYIQGEGTVLVAFEKHGLKHKNGLSLCFYVEVFPELTSSIYIVPSH